VSKEQSGKVSKSCSIWRKINSIMLGAKKSVAVEEIRMRKSQVLCIWTIGKKS
jgi:hypothetical protein